MASGCLVDVYDTILKSNFDARIKALSQFLDVDVDAWLGEWLKTRAQRDRGKLTMAKSFAQSLPAFGIEPVPELVDELSRKDAELMRDSTRVFDDTVPFFAGLRSQGILIALVSNCADTTRPLLADLGLIPLVDAVVLSCEVGSVKPAPEIYVTALADLGVAATDAVMIDDQPAFCAGAEAVGVRAIQISRRDLDGQPPASGFPVVRSLLDAPALF